MASIDRPIFLIVAVSSKRPLLAILAWVPSYILPDITWHNLAYKIVLCQRIYRIEMKVFLTFRNLATDGPIKDIFCHSHKIILPIALVMFKSVLLSDIPNRLSSYMTDSSS